MITRDDCTNLLLALEDEGVNIDLMLKKLMVSKDVPMEVLKFIVDNQGLEAMKFYEFLRKAHNKKNSKLYTSIINPTGDALDTVATLSSLLTQIALHGKHVDNPDIFFREVRADEITKSLTYFYTEENPTTCNKILQCVRTDLMVLEYLNGQRELEN